MRPGDTSTPHDHHDAQMIKFVGKTVKPQAVVGEDMKETGQAKAGDNGNVVRRYGDSISGAAAGRVGDGIKPKESDEIVEELDSADEMGPYIHCDEQRLDRPEGRSG